MKIDFRDRVIIVTGAARGLGLEYAQCLLAHGAIVCMHDGGVDKNGDNPNPDLIERVAGKQRTDRAVPVCGLLNSREECLSLVADVVQKYGSIDGLVHNAGLVLWEETTAVSADTFKASSVINHEAGFWLCQAVLPHMQAREYGRIVLTSSGWALGAHPGSEKLTLYCMSKGAQFGLGMSLANGTGQDDILLNVIAPIANTRVYASEVPQGTLLPESVAGSVAWLLSDACSINGKVLKVANGSLSLMEMTEIAGEDLGER